MNQGAQEPSSASLASSRGGRHPRLLGRRTLVLGSAAAAGFVVWEGWSHLRSWLADDLDFTPIDDPSGFRRFGSGAVSGGFDQFAGLGASSREVDGSTEASVRADLCRVLFGRALIPAGTVPIAYFSDFRCPYCRVLSPRLAAIEARSGGDVTIAWHEWPILGTASVNAARASLAAGRQGAYQAFHERLITSPFLPTPAYLAELAERVGIDPVRLVADMDSAAVVREIATSNALAGLFRFRGTPGLVVGRTVVNGAIDDTALAALLERERSEGPPPGCASQSITNMRSLGEQP